MPHLGGHELLLILLIVLLLFGATRLPRLAKSVRQAREELEKPTVEAGESK